MSASVPFDQVLARVDDATESLALHETIGKPGRVNGTKEIAISEDIVLVFDQQKNKSGYREYSLHKPC